MYDDGTCWVEDYATPAERLDPYKVMGEFFRTRDAKIEEAIALLTKLGWKVMPPRG